MCGEFTLTTLITTRALENLLTSNCRSLNSWYTDIQTKAHRCRKPPHNRTPRVSAWPPPLPLLPVLIARIKSPVSHELGPYSIALAPMSNVLSLSRPVLRYWYIHKRSDCLWRCRIVVGGTFDVFYISMSVCTTKFQIETLHHNLNQNFAPNSNQNVVLNLDSNVAPTTRLIFSTKFFILNFASIFKFIFCIKFQTNFFFSISYSKYCAKSQIDILHKIPNRTLYQIRN